MDGKGDLEMDGEQKEDWGEANRIAFPEEETGYPGNFFDTRLHPDEETHMPIREDSDQEFFVDDDDFPEPYDQEADSYTNPEQEADLAYALELQMKINQEDGLVEEDSDSGAVAPTPPPVYEEAVGVAGPDVHVNNGVKKTGPSVTVNKDVRKTPYQPRPLPVPPSRYTVRGRGTVPSKSERQCRNNSGNEDKERKERQVQEKVDYELALQLESDEQKHNVDHMRDFMHPLMDQVYRNPLEPAHVPLDHHDHGGGVHFHEPSPSPRDALGLRFLLARRCPHHHPHHHHHLHHHHHGEDIPDDYEALLELEDRIGEVKKRGLDEKDFDALPTNTYEANAGKETTCKICMEQFERDEAVRHLPCFHYFHIACIDEWLKINGVCPVCRLDVKEQIGSGHS